jgi:hypothetical protein
MALCGGFLLAVLWFDLMFDVQVLGAPAGPLPEEALASIAAYYARVTTAADPMGNLVGLVMVVAVLGTGAQLVRRTIPRPLAAVALVASTAPIALASARIVPNAARLGTRSDTLELQSELARAICYEHIACFASMLVFCTVQLAAAGPRARR